ncbi:MAG: aspartate aminotransferase family protein [Chitinispirillales bacterium]|jgi:predicted acetylornithine/succinylornithine family transaminase|nr:aspartate aminotransferase family protein [Chitinispirillales bacterium]
MKAKTKNVKTAKATTSRKAAAASAKKAKAASKKATAKKTASAKAKKAKPASVKKTKAATVKKAKKSTIKRAATVKKAAAPKIMMDVSPEEIFVPTYKRGGAPFVRGGGMYIYDSDGKEYLDFGAGIAVNALGHAHPALIKELNAQGRRVIHTSNLYYNEPQIELAAKLVKHSFATKVFLCNSGTEANEAAIKFARKRGTKASSQKFHVLSFSDGFHGRTYGALSATAQPKFHVGIGPLPDGFHYAPFNDIQYAKATLDNHDFAAIIVEPLQGEGGINAASVEFLRFLREYATEHAISLIFDEIQCGMGRTGTLWCHEQSGVTPDIMTLAKPLGGGLPLGAVLCIDDVASCISPGDHGTTFGGNPVACALGSKVIDIVSDKKLLTKVQENGDYLKGKLTTLADKFPSVDHIRGTGLIIGVRMKDDPLKLVDECRNKGLLVIKAGMNTIRFMPPLIVGRKDIDKAVKIFESALSAN